MIDYETGIMMQRICTGEELELTRGQIAAAVVDIDKITHGMDDESAVACRDFYEKLTGDDTRRQYDAELLMTETESIKKEMDDFVKGTIDGSLDEMLDAMDDFFMNVPFEGLDGIEYGVNEVCVFSVLEYFKWKTCEGHDHEKSRKAYRDNIAKRTFEEVGDHWIGVYDKLQKRYDDVCAALEETATSDAPSAPNASNAAGASPGAAAAGLDRKTLREEMAACCIISVAAIRDQDGDTLDILMEAAPLKGRKIVREYDMGTYEEGESTLNDNALRLLDFITENISQ